MHPRQSKKSDGAGRIRTALPKRPEAHQLEERSERFFRAHLPMGWTCEKQVHDYGIDLQIEIFEDGDATGRELIVQLKGSQSAHGGATENVRLQTTTYNYLKRNLRVAMLVKFVADENEAYWILIREIPRPTQRARTFSVQIPRENRLSTLNWDDIRRRVHRITDTKLSAARKLVERRNRKSRT
jgi:hypothetical protein